MKRKIVQIKTMYGFQWFKIKTFLIALCDDGSLWQSSKQGWRQIEPIPQPEDNDK